MAITAICGACGRKFAAPSQFQGKRVKCKGCGEIFMVPSAPVLDTFSNDPEPENDSLATLAAVAMSESAMGSDQSLLDRSRHTIASPRSEIDPQPPVALGQSFRSGLAPNVLTFNYPGASDIDQWLPVVMIVLGFLLLASSVSSPDAKGIAWISFVRFITPTLLYLGLTFPVTLGMLSRASRQLRFALPPNYKLRCFACYMPAFVFITWMQMGGEGFSIAQLFVGIIGLAFSSGLVWLLFRLREEHIGTTIAYGGGGFAAGVVLTLALTVGLNKMGVLIVTSQHAEASVPASPFGQGLAWVSPPPPLPVVHVNPAPAQVLAVATTTEVPLTPLPDSAVMGSFDPGAISGVFDEIINPLGTSSNVGVVRNRQNSLVIESWNTEIWQRQPRVLQLPSHPQGKIVMSTDGDRLAWIAEFPRLCVQVWSYNHGTVVTTIDLDKSAGHTELVGFISPDLLLVDKVITSTAGAVEAPAPPENAVATASTEPPAAVNSTPGENKLSDALAGASDHMRAKLPPTAVPTVDETPVAPAPAKVAIDSNSEDKSGSPAGHQMSLVDVTTGSTVRGFSLPPLASDLGAGWGKPLSETLHYGQNIALSVTSRRLAAATRVDDTPALMQIDLTTGRMLPIIKITELDPGLSGFPTGIAYSNDGLSLATLFENNGSALLLAYDSTTGKRISNFVYPAGPLDGEQHGEFRGSAIAWLDPSPFWLVYGQGIISTQTGAHVKSADLDPRNATEQRMLDDDRIQIITEAAGTKRLNVLKLDRSKLEASQN